MLFTGRRRGQPCHGIAIRLAGTVFRTGDGLAQALGPPERRSDDARSSDVRVAHVADSRRADTGGSAGRAALRYDDDGARASGRYGSAVLRFQGLERPARRRD